MDVDYGKFLQEAYDDGHRDGYADAKKELCELIERDKKEKVVRIKDDIVECPICGLEFMGMVNFCMECGQRLEFDE